ncbi:MAG TPA: PDZ domain-containing protein [Gemmatimonadales bacterium]|nr:PDZ domain-containing protein [Gemmatimonadales bacterium]
MPTLNRLTRYALVGAAALALPSLPAEGQERMRARAFDHQARLGIRLEMHADERRDKLGAEIDDVLPGSPAEEAGLKPGDIIAKFNGTTLGGVSAEDEEESGPARKLLELARELEPGDTVRLEYRRGDQTRQATVVAEVLGPSFARIPGLELRRMPGMRHFELDPPHFEFGPGHFEMFFEHGVLGGLQLVSLNDDLGEYFGTKEGVLVVKAPRDTSIGLKAGDVILAIDGRKPESPGHAMRILRSYAAGETAKLEVMRQKRRITVSWKAPEREPRWRVPGERRRRSSSGRA